MSEIEPIESGEPIVAVLLGDQKIGKTSLFKKFLDKKFEQDYVSTLTVDSG